MDGKMSTPEIGMGATLYYHSDRVPATVIYISRGGKLIHLQEDAFKRIDNNGMSEDQRYEYAQNREGVIYPARLTKKGWKVQNGPLVALGVRRRYYDFSF